MFSRNRGLGNINVIQVRPGEVPESVSLERPDTGQCDAAELVQQKYDVIANTIEIPLANVGLRLRPMQASSTVQSFTNRIIESVVVELNEIPLENETNTGEAHHDDFTRGTSISTNVNVVAETSEDITERELLGKSPEIMTFLKIATFMGMIPTGIVSLPNCNSFLSYVQRAWFGIVLILCFTQSLTFLKPSLLKEDRNPEETLEMVNDVILFITLWIYLFTFVIRFDKVADYMKSLVDDGKNIARHLSYLPVFSAVLSSFVVVSAVFEIHLSQWTPTSLAKLHSTRMKDFLYKWDNRNETDWETVPNENISIFLSILGVLTQYSFNLLLHFYRDLYLLLAVAFCGSTTKFCETMKEQLTALNAENQFETITGFKDSFETLREGQEKFQDAFGLLFNVFHVNNLFTCVYFIDTVVQNKYADLILVSCIFITKIWLVYYYAAKSTEVNDFFWKIIRDNRSVFVAAIGEGSVQFLLDDITKNPIGLGNNIFFVDKSFIGQLLAAIISYFVIITTNRRPNNAA